MSTVFLILEFLPNSFFLIITDLYLIYLNTSSEKKNMHIELKYKLLSV